MSFEIDIEEKTTKTPPREVEIAARINNLSKVYQIYNCPQDRLKQIIYPYFQKLMGRPARKYYSEFWALKNISFEINKGETLGIIGRNGSGKSTLLQIICGTLGPTEGNVAIAGRVAALLELGSGFNHDFTGRENVYLYASILGLSVEKINSRYQDIIAFADIGDFINQPLKTYSSGMIVRLAFSVIAHVDADILVIDEALAVGDVFFVQKCMRFLRSFMKKGTVIFVSHDAGAVLNLCQKVIWLDHGLVQCIGEPKEVMERYTEEQYASIQNTKATQKIHSPNLIQQHEIKRDMRLDFINHSNLRNDIEIFKFDESGADFGNSRAVIKKVSLLDQNNQALSWLVGGEKVKLRIQCLAIEKLKSPIIGFQIKDRLGQIIFADNTYLSYANSPVKTLEQEQLEAVFEFVMPIMAIGDYTISVALADGTQENHLQCHWIHDAIAFKSHASSICHGLIGVPMIDVKLRTTEG